MIRFVNAPPVARADATLDLLVVTRASRAPDAIAVVSPDGDLTYGELVAAASNRTYDTINPARRTS